jgi:hypothetical protein
MLELILHNRRWNCRSRVRRALLHNPNLPEADALRLVGLLNRTELRDFASDHRLSSNVNFAVRRRLASVQ